jgi:hypothetical protein
MAMMLDRRYYAGAVHSLPAGKARINQPFQLHFKREPDE